MAVNLLSAMAVLADTHYVSMNSRDPREPYTSWLRAAHNIQDAIERASAGDTVLVSNGVYNTGGKAGYESSCNQQFVTWQSNRVAISKTITVRSLNGPSLTTIEGFRDPNGNAAADIRCVWMTNTAVLAGFTLTNGAARSGGRGGGVYAGHIWNGYPPENATISNCVIVGNNATFGGGCGGWYGGYVAVNCIIAGNTADESGGGIDNGDLLNCALVGNTATVSGGGAYSSGTLTHCTVTGNKAPSVGGIGADADRCVVYYNEALANPNYDPGRALTNCCTTPEPRFGGANMTNSPQLASSIHLSSLSPCIGRVAPPFSGPDIDGEPWQTPAAIGCDEYNPGAVTGALSVAIRADYTNVAVGYAVALTADIVGRATESKWTFDDGSAAANQPYVSRAWPSGGSHPVTLTAWNETYPNGVSAAVTIRVVEKPLAYVACSNATPLSPFTNWMTAATTIQEAIDAAPVGAEILVSNGVYASGRVLGYPAGSAHPNRVAVYKPLSVRSVNGPSVTVIQGQPPGADPMRCVYLAHGSVLAGFTLTNGCGFKDEAGARWGGGGAWGEGVDAVVSNCVISGNCASSGPKDSNGGGAYRATLYNCLVVGNTTTSGVTYGRGGGVKLCVVYNSELRGNSSLYYGGGAEESVLHNCMIKGNSAGNGGGASNCKLRNCLVVGNTANNNGGVGGNEEVSYCTVVSNSGYGVDNRATAIEHCIVYNNTPGNFDTRGPLHGKMNYSCTVPLPPDGVGNMTNVPLFVSSANGDFRLQALSPCVDAGHNLEWMFGATDLDGRPRILNGTADLGCYETPYFLRLKIWLQGPYLDATHRMTTDLTGSLPLRSPYASDRRAVVGVPSNATDWVNLELRRATNSTAAVGRSVFLSRDGYLTDDSGSDVVPLDLGAGNYYIVVQHRNHLAAMSASSVAFTNSMVQYDFTTNSARFYGGTGCAVQLEPNVWGMAAGDVDGDGKVTVVDRAVVSNQVGKTGYLNGDVNLDGVVNAED